MQGTILDYSKQKQGGVISGNDNNRYSFSINEWKGKKAPISGGLVDFNIEETNAVDIHSIAPQYTQGKTSLLAVFSLIVSVIFFGIGSIPAVVMGHMANSKIKKSQGQLRGSGVALAGLIIGYMGVAVLVVAVIAAIALPKLAAV